MKEVFENPIPKNDPEDKEFAAHLQGLVFKDKEVTAKMILDLRKRAYGE